MRQKDRKLGEQNNITGEGMMDKSLRKDRREDWNGRPQNLQITGEGWQTYQGILYYTDIQANGRVDTQEAVSDFCDELGHGEASRDKEYVRGRYNGQSYDCRRKGTDTRECYVGNESSRDKADRERQGSYKAGYQDSYQIGKEMHRSGRKNKGKTTDKITGKTTGKTMEPVRKQAPKSKVMFLAMRRRTRRRRIRKVLVALLIAAAFCTGFFGRTLFDAYAKESAGTQNRYYTSIQVEPGDNLWNIASRYAKETDYSIPEYVEELKRMNGLADGHIHAGEYLTIVYFSE